MSNYGEIAYEDLSLLNAQWQQARPAMQGLGDDGRQHQYRDVSYLNARLRPILPATVGMPPGTGADGTLSGNSIGIGTMTLDETNITGGATSFTTAQILQLQDQLSGRLLMNGYEPLQVDGKLGPSTCGAIIWYQKNIDRAGGSSFEGGCDPSTAIPPTKKGSGGSSSRTAGGTLPAPGAAAKAGMFGTGGGTNWMLWGGAVAAIAVGGALMLKASKKR